MLRHILVPLDGSACAEQALPLAAQIARTSGGTLTLLQVITPPVYADLLSVGRLGYNMLGSSSAQQAADSA